MSQRAHVRDFMFIPHTRALYLELWGLNNGKLYSIQIMTRRLIQNVMLKDRCGKDEKLL